MLWPLAFFVLFTIIAWNSYSERKEYFLFLGNALIVMVIGAGVAVVVGFCFDKTPIVTETKNLTSLIQSAGCTCSKQIFIMPSIIGLDEYISFRFRTSPPSKVIALPAKNFKQKKSNTNSAYLEYSELQFKKLWYYFFAINFSPKLLPGLYIPEGGKAQ